jgi:hypothetical protein
MLVDLKSDRKGNEMEEGTSGERLVRDSSHICAQSSTSLQFASFVDCIKKRRFETRRCRYSSTDVFNVRVWRSVKVDILRVE